MRRLICGLALLALVSPASAGDGVVEINQARALAGGVTPGDTAGFPVTINRSGSYRLTGELVVTTEDTTAIEVSASHVTIDMGGFTIRCNCAQGDPFVVGAGILITDFDLYENVAVRNGKIVGMWGNAIAFQRGIISNVQAIGNRGSLTNHEGIVSDSIAERNSFGIVAALAFRNVSTNNTGPGFQTSGVIFENVSRANESNAYQGGISVYLSNVATGSENEDQSLQAYGLNAGSSVVYGNQISDNEDGIIGSRSLIQSNVFRANDEYALNASYCGYRENVFANNGTGNVEIGNEVNLGANLCDGALCPP